MLGKITNFLESMHSKGFPIPLVRDKNEGSVSSTLVWLSFTIAARAILKELSGESIMYALGLFGMCGSMYWGKKWDIRRIGAINIGKELDNKEEKDQDKE